jgi:hypothetical protein
MPELIISRRVKPVRNDNKSMLFTNFEFFRVLENLGKKGQVEKILTHQQLHYAVTKGYDELGPNAKLLLAKYGGTRSRSIGGKPKDGEPLKRAFISTSADDSSMEIVVPKETFERHGGPNSVGKLVVWDYSDTNTRLEFHSDGKSVTAELLNPKDARIPMLPLDGMVSGEFSGLYNSLSVTESAGALSRSRSTYEIGIDKKTTAFFLHLLGPEQSSGILMESVLPSELKGFAGVVDAISKKKPGELTNDDLRNISLLAALVKELPDWNEY